MYKLSINIVQQQARGKWLRCTNLLTAQRLVFNSVEGNSWVTV